MVFKCKCGVEERCSIHKDGYELVGFVCPICREKAVLKGGPSLSKYAMEVSNSKRITLQDGDFFFVPRNKLAS